MKQIFSQNDQIRNTASARVNTSLSDAIAKTEQNKKFNRIYMREKEDTPYSFKRHVLSFRIPLNLLLRLFRENKRGNKEGEKRLQFSVSAVSPTARINNYFRFLKKEKVLIITLRQNLTSLKFKVFIFLVGCSFHFHQQATHQHLSLSYLFNQALYQIYFLA